MPSLVWKLFRLFNIGWEKTLKDNVTVINRFVFDIIEKNRKATSSCTGRKDLVAQFLCNKSVPLPETKESFDAVYLRDILLNFVIAGRDTTAQALSWFFYEMSMNPRVLQRLREEIASTADRVIVDNVVNGREQDHHAVVKMCESMPYLDAVIKETLRLHPSVPIDFKYCNEDDVMPNGTRVHRGIHVVYSMYVMARMCRIWGEDAEEFVPERWLGPQGEKVSPFKFNSFNAGPRMCLGKALATMELKMVSLVLLSTYDFVREGGNYQMHQKPSLTLPIQGGLRVRVRPSKTSI